MIRATLLHHLRAFRGWRLWCRLGLHDYALRYRAISYSRRGMVELVCRRCGRHREDGY
jgi:hypothetical protein